MGRRVFAAYLFCLSILFSLAQTSYSPAIYKYHKKDYFVYPVRSSNLDGVPPSGFNLPDGDYIIFTDYSFKTKLFSGKETLRDTTKISAIFTLKNNFPNGKATFYFYEYRFLGNKERRKPSSITTGTFFNGLKEGEWKDFTENKIYAIRNFKSGLLHGYVLSYGLNGKPERQEKFNNDRACDTVFYYYSNGNIRLMYDVFNPMNDTSTPPPENFNDFFLKSSYKYNIIGSDNVVKSFYKSFSADGKPENFIRFTSGKNPVFDTLYTGGRGKVVIKEFRKPGEEPKHLVELYYDVVNSKTGDEKNARYEYYDGYEIYQYKVVSYNTKTKKTDSTAFSMIDIKKLDYDSWRDTVIATSYAGGKTTKTHFVPVLGYLWTEYASGRSLMKPYAIDSAKQIITVIDTFHYRPSSLFKTREILYKEVKHSVKSKPGKEPFRKFDFLFLFNSINIHNYFSEPVPYSADYGFKDICNKFSGTEKTATYFYEGQLINGKNIITNSKKLVKKKIFDKELKTVFTDAIYTTVQRAGFKNGKRDGELELLIKNNYKNISNDFQKSFWKNPSEDENYIIANYQNGDLNGNLKEYKSEMVDVFFARGSKLGSKSELHSFLFRDVNYTDGLLNGTYTTFHYTGKPAFTANFNRGKMNGAVTLFSSEGMPLLSCDLKNDSMHGDCIVYRSDGKKIQEAHFENNQLNGNHVVYSWDESTEKNIPVLKITAKKNILNFKQISLKSGQVLEEINFSASSGFEFCEDIAGFDNFLETRKRKAVIEGEEKMFASYKAYYENGNVLCEGEIIKGNPKGKWNFYNVNGILINEVLFSDTAFLPPGNTEPVQFAAAVTGYFNNGKTRCKGFVKDWESGYDCATHTDKTKFGIFYSDVWLYDGTQIIKNGTGKGIICDENGSKIAAGEFLNYKEEGVWKYFDPNEKLNETGKYIHGEKDGLWYSGDLENLNFEDAACFDPQDKESMKQLEYSKKQIMLTTELYKNGALMDSETFETDLNKERNERVKEKF